MPYKGAQAVYQDLIPGPGRPVLRQFRHRAAAHRGRPGQGDRGVLAGAARVPPARADGARDRRARFRDGDLGRPVSRAPARRQPALARLRADFDKVMAQPEVAAMLEKRGARPVRMTLTRGRGAGRAGQREMDAAHPARRHPRRLTAPAVRREGAGCATSPTAFAGITRKRVGGGLGLLPAQRRAHHATRDERKRLNTLAIPPAWTDVWICPDPDGHIQATARDARGRKQYRYHPSYREARDRSKFRRMLEFSEVLPLLRERVERDLRGARPQPPPAARHRGAPARPHADPRRQRRVRAREQVLRPDHAAAGATCRSTARRCASASAARAASSTPSRVADPRLAKIIQRCQRPAGPGDVPVPRRGEEAPGGVLRRRQRRTCARSPAATSPRRTSAPGAAPCSPRSSCARWARRRAGARPTATSSRAIDAVRRAPRQHAHGLPQVLRPSGAARAPT